MKAEKSPSPDKGLGDEIATAACQGGVACGGVCVIAVDVYKTCRVIVELYESSGLSCRVGVGSDIVIDAMCAKAGDSRSLMLMKGVVFRMLEWGTRGWSRCSMQYSYNRPSQRVCREKGENRSTKIHSQMSRHRQRTTRAARKRWRQKNPSGTVHCKRIVRRTPNTRS